MSDKVVFFDSDHSYWVGDRQIPSVGKYMSQFFPEFNGNYWMKHKAMTDVVGEEYTKHFRSFKQPSPDEYLLFNKFSSNVDPLEYDSRIKHYDDLWGRKRAESAFKGTKFHAKMENKFFKNKLMPNPWDGQNYPVKKYKKEYDNESLCDNLYDLPDGGYPELLIFDPNKTVAGQADMVFIKTIDDIRYVSINDWKTNEKKPPKSSPDKMNAPFEHMPASKHNRYLFQINFYAYLLSLHGFVPKNLAYEHVTNYNEYETELIDLENITALIHEAFTQY